MKQGADKPDRGGFFRTLPFKIGLIIILAQLLVFAVIGFFYSAQYESEVYQQIEVRAMLPAELMSRGLLGIDAMNDRATMEELLKIKLDKGMVIGLNRIIFSSLDSADPGRPLAEIEEVHRDLFNFSTPASIIRHEKNALVAVAPVVGSDGRTLRFFTYLQMPTSAAVAKSKQFRLLFVAGSLLAVFATSVIILVSFKYLINRRLAALLSMVRKVENGDLTARIHTRHGDDELGLLQHGVNAMASQLEKNVTFLEQQVNERTSHLKRSARLVEKLNSIHDLENLLFTSVFQIHQRFSYYQVHIYLIEGDDLVHGAGYPEYEVVLDRIPVAAEISLAAQAARSMETVIVNDIRQVDNWLRDPGMVEGLTEIDIPLVHEGRVLGVLNVQCREADGVNDGDTNLLRSLAGHIAVALDNIRLFKELKQQSKKLQQVNELLEERVSQRTNELLSSNIKLQNEIEERKSVESQLRQAQKMEALGRLTGGVAHDFNNILTVIIGNCDLLLRLAGDGEEYINEHVGQIHTAARQAAALTNQLLAFSRQQVLQSSIVDLNEIINDINKMILRLLGENISLETSLAPDLYPIYVDRSQIEQILLNLAVNAADAMDGRGCLEISTRNLVIGRDNAAAYPVMEEGGYVCLEIKDNGTGISEEILSKIFDPFFTTKKLGKGTGLGLATVHGIVSQSGGTITVASEQGQGTTFSICFPQAAGNEGTGQESKKVEVRPASGPETILLVEDEPMVREVARVVLTDLGYVILEAENGEEGLELAEATDEKISLLLTDIRMPGAINGFALADALAGMYPDIKVLFMSGYIDVDRQNKEETSFIQKPFTLKDLSHKVRETLDR